MKEEDEGKSEGKKDKKIYKSSRRRKEARTDESQK